MRALMRSAPLWFAAALTGCTSVAPMLLNTISIAQSGGTGGTTRFGGAAADPMAQKVYVANSSNQSLDVIDTKDMKVVKQITGLPNSVTSLGAVLGANGVAVAPSLGKAWVTDEVDNLVHVYDLAALVELKKIDPKVTGLDSIAFDPMHGRVLVVGNTTKAVVALDAMTDAILGQLTLPGTPGAGAWDPIDGTYRQNIASTDQVLVIDPMTLMITRTLPIAKGCSPRGLAVNSQNGNLAVGCNVELSQIISGDDGTVLGGSANVGGADQVVYNPIDNRYFVCAAKDRLGPVLGIFDATSYAWLGNVPTDSGARTITVDATSGKLFVFNTNSKMMVYSPETGAQAK